MRPTIANANILRFRNELRPEGVANVAGLLEPIVSQVKNSLNEATRVSPSGSNVVETPEYYRNLPSTNIPVGDFLVGNADRALLDVSQHRPPDPYDVIDLGLLGVDAFFPARGAVKLTGKALTSPFAKDIYANVPNAVNRLNQRFTGVDLQPQIFIGEKSPLFDNTGGNSKKFLKNEKTNRIDEEDNYLETKTFRGVDGKLRQEVDDSQSFLKIDDMEEGKVYPIAEVFDHPYLEQADPNVYKNLKVKKEYKPESYDGGSYNPETNVITINTGTLDNDLLTKGFFDYDKETGALFGRQVVDPQNIFLHELQHAIQYSQGFDTGTNTAKAGHLDFRLKDLMRELTRGGKEEWTKEKGAVASEIKSILEDVIEPTKARSEMFEPKQYESSVENRLYKGKSGEQEARTVQFRRNLTQAERDKYYPRYESLNLDPIYKNYDTADAESIRLDAFKKGKLKRAYGQDMPTNFLYETRTLEDLKNKTPLKDDVFFKNLSYLKSTPKNIDPRVGNRFEKEYVGDLVKPKTITGKELEGATIVTKPSDVTSRGEKIKSISDEFFEQQPPTTEGGFDFALSKKNIKEGKYYGSGLEQVDTDTRRMLQAFRENKAQGGSGRMMFTPSTMGTYSESFSTMPFENLMPILAKAKPEAIAKVNNEIRQIYPEFSGLNTSAGTAEILNHGNLRKLAMERLRTKSAQENLGYNAEDLYNAVRSERFVGVGKNMIGDTLVEMDTALLQRADDMLNDAGITNLSQSKEARKARSPEQNAVLDEVYAMFRKDMGDSHRTYKVANTGATENRFTLDANLPLIEVAGDNMINDIMRGKVDYSIDANKAYSSDVTPDQAQNIIHTGHKNVGLFIDPARAKRIDDARKSGQFDRKVTSIMDDVIYNFPDNKSMSKVYPLDPEIKSYRDIPNKDWLEHKRDRARLRGFGDVGSHIGSAITGGFQDNVVVPTKVLKEIQGLNLEQQNVRPDSLEYLKDYMSKNKHLPKWYSGYDIYKTGYHGGVGRNLPLGIEGVREDVPFIQVDQYGQPFVNEGNHRIMTANKLGWENLPIELRYFEGGNIESGLLNPDLIKEYNRTGNPNIFDDELQKYIEKVKTNKLIADYYLKKLGKK